MGATGIVIERSDDIVRHELFLRNLRSPVVVDVRIDSSVKMPRHRRFEELRSSATPKRAN
jgi:hypothetical protein